MNHRQTLKLFLISLFILHTGCESTGQHNTSPAAADQKSKAASNPALTQTPSPENHSSNDEATKEDARPFVELIERCKHTPIGKAKATPLTGGAPLKVTFEDNKSYDPDGKKIVRWEWHFGNGQSKEGKTVTYVYEKPGKYGIGLNVIDSDGQKTSDCSDLNTGIVVVVTGKEDDAAKQVPK